MVVKKIVALLLTGVMLAACGRDTT